MLALFDMFRRTDIQTSWPSMSPIKIHSERQAAALLLVVVSIIAVFTVQAVSRHADNPLFYGNMSAELNPICPFFTSSVFPDRPKL